MNAPRTEKLVMAKSTLGQFGYELFKRTPEHTTPMHPFVRLCLENWGDSVGPSGAPAISPHLMTEREIEVHVELLKADLDAVATRAKRGLQVAVAAHRANPSKN